MEKDEIGFDLALISKFVTKKKRLRSTKKSTLLLMGD
jgi:hypothetical protein